MAGSLPDTETPDFYQGLSDFIRHGNPDGLGALFQCGFDPAIAAIYRNGFYRSCREVLVSTFPSVHHIVGDDRFAALARNYTARHGPSRGTLTGYGKGFPEWLAINLARPQPWLAAIAHLDWAWLSCLHGGDATPLDTQGLQSLLAGGADMTRLSVSLLPNAQLVSATREAFAWWSDHKRGENIPPPADTTAAEPRMVLMWRPAMKVYVRGITEAEHLFLAELARHRALGSASASVLEAVPGFDLASHFAELLTNGLLQLGDQIASEPGNT
jgi:hypothetical protein